MPERIVRPGILTSESINSLSWAAEVFYRRLMSVADDYGRFDGRIQVLRASLYPLQLDHVSDADVRKWRLQSAEAGVVSVYEVDGKEFVQIAKFNQRMRGKPRWPAPNDGDPPQLAATRGDCPPSSYSETETETEAQTPLSAFADDGERFPPEMLRLWDQSPPKARERSSRKQCLAEWKRQKCGKCPDAVMAGLDAWKRSAKWMEQAGQFVPALHRWLSHRQWTEPPEPFDPHAVGLDPADAAMIDRLYGERRSA